MAVPLFALGCVSQSPPQNFLGTPLVSLWVDFGNGTMLGDDGIAFSNQTALSLLEGEANKWGVNVYEQYYAAYGETLVTGIGPLPDGDGGKYWVYRVDGTLLPVGADKAHLKPGDSVVWSFEKSPYG